MGKFFKKNYLFIIFIVIQSIFYIITGMNKEYIHIDEAYSFGLTHYDKVEIQENEDFYDNWHGKDYYNQYLTVQKDEAKDLKPVYENQKNDVHPPLYYLLLRIPMNIAGEHFSKWTGISLNVVIYAFITVVMYLIVRKMLAGEKNADTKAQILAFLSSVTLASLSNAIYIRMYALLTLEILITTLLHIKLLENEKLDSKVLVCISISVIAGALTHYFYFFYIFILYFIFAVKYVKKKDKKGLVCYTITMIISGIIVFAIFPYFINHMFFGYRGQGAISNFEKISQIGSNILEQTKNLNYYGFNNSLYIIIPMIIGLLIYRKVRKVGKIDLNRRQKEIFIVILIASSFFFVMAAIASPWRVLRYIVPVCSILFVAVIYYLYKLLQTIFNEKTSNIIMLVLFCIILILPIVCKMKPELLYQDKKECVQKLSGELNLPTLYLFNSKTSGFLDDIWLFSLIDESYIAKDLEYTEENIRKIIYDKDTSNGMIIFISEKEDYDTILQILKNATGLEKTEHIKKLNTSEVYHIW